jgi:hypothetical protein
MTRFGSDRIAVDLCGCASRGMDRRSLRTTCGGDLRGILGEDAERGSNDEVRLVELDE